MRTFFLVLVMALVIVRPGYADLDSAVDALKEGDYSTALEKFLPLADEGDPIAQYNLGYMNTSGLGIPINYHKGCDWYEKSARQGIAHAQHSIGACFYRGKGRPQDYSQAISWYEKAMAQGFPKSTCALGEMYLHGEGVPRDQEQGADMCLWAAKKGEPTAQLTVGQYYLRNKDFASAGKWLIKAAEQGLSKAQFNIGLMYRNGDGVAKNDKSASIWFKKAALQGHGRAMLMLGNHYFTSSMNEQEKTIDPDIAGESYFWLKLSVNMLNDEISRNDAVERSAFLKSIFSADFVASLDRRVEEWQPQSSP